MNTISILLKRFYAGMREGHGFYNKIKAAFGLPLISFLSPISLTMKKFGKSYTVHFRTGSDVAMWMEVFFDEEYRLPDDFFPKKILDLGANAGFCSLYFVLRDPEAYLVAIEPDPHNFELLLENVFGRSKIMSLQVAVAFQSGEREFFSVKNQGMKSSFVSQPSADIIKVRTMSLNDLFDKLEWRMADLIKFDIEGAEWEVFTGAPLNRAEAVIGEYHEDLTKRPVSDFLKLFSSFRHSLQMISPKRYIIYFYPKRI